MAWLGSVLYAVLGDGLAWLNATQLCDSSMSFNSSFSARSFAMSFSILRFSALSSSAVCVFKIREITFEQSDILHVTTAKYPVKRASFVSWESRQA